MRHAVILAGGIGSRFWPLSRARQPKQFLNICSGRSMLEDTIHKIKALIEVDNIYIATNKAYAAKVKFCLKKLSLKPDNVLFEPEGKNTLAAIGVLSLRIKDIDPDAVVTVLPCDNFIRQPDKFKKCIAVGIDMAKQGYIVTLGITPTRPETGYGYIKIKSKIKNHPSASLGAGKSKIYKVDRFVEKPALASAKKFIKDKRYYWNNGIFIFRPQVMLDEIKRFMPGAYNLIMEMKNQSRIRRLWHKLPNISIDYAIMQKTRKTLVLVADYGWNDLGNWQALAETMRKDKRGNVFRGKCIDIGSSGVIAWSDKRLIATLGLEDTIIVDAEDALLVCAKERAQEVKGLARVAQERFRRQV